ncbi:unnamed protein product [Pieris macdunnoughi]|nr:unnamed protein product [Pieris macdunnoughi]
MITEAFLAVMDCNVIVVDWQRLAGQGCNTAARGVPDLGNHLGSFIWVDSLLLTGFSLGAYVVCNAGRQIGGRARRETGLDSAGPTCGGNSQALNRNCGRYVEGIHTDGRTRGFMNLIAHADFYPNG